MGELADARRAEPKPLTKDEVRQLLRECVTVVKPGEVLVIRAYETWTVQQAREMQDVLNAMHEHGTVPFRSLVVPGAELGVAEAPDAGNPAMICPPCRKDEHLLCPELARQAAAERVVPVTRSEIANGQQCDCQHQPRRSDAAGRVPYTPMRNLFRRPA